MIGNSEVMAFVGTTQPERAKAFYGDTLGLTLLEDSWWAIIFEAGGAHLHIQKVPQKFSPLPFTALGWKVADIKGEVEALSRKGITFERYKELEEQQDSLGIWTAPGGAAKVCWFKDPDGNTLSLTQFP
ncbi:MAG: VOC family protein [Candidatus Binataceae bacterium]